LSGKVTVTASPCTGWAHHAQGRTGCPCRHHGRVTFALFLPFRRSMGVTPPTRSGPETPPAHAESIPPLPGHQRYAGRRAEARDAREDGVPISWPWSVACSTSKGQRSPKSRPQPWSVLAPLVNLLPVDSAGRRPRGLRDGGAVRPVEGLAHAAAAGGAPISGPQAAYASSYAKRFARRRWWCPCETVLGEV